MTNCLRCGKCCYFLDKDGKSRPCRFLVQLGRITHCRIYKNRLGTKIYEGYFCGLRTQQKKYIIGCPLNPIE